MCAYPMVPALTQGGLIKVLCEKYGCSLTEKIIEVNNQPVRFRVLIRRDNGQELSAVITPEYEDGDRLNPSRIRSVVRILKISPREFGFDLD